CQPGLQSTDLPTDLGCGYPQAPGSLREALCLGNRYKLSDTVPCKHRYSWCNKCRSDTKITPLILLLYSKSVLTIACFIYLFVINTIHPSHNAKLRNTVCSARSDRSKSVVSHNPPRRKYVSDDQIQ